MLYQEPGKVTGTLSMPFPSKAKLQGLDARDTGIDLVAQTQGTGEDHAIQCKFYAEDYPILIASFRQRIKSR